MFSDRVIIITAQTKLRTSQLNDIANRYTTLTISVDGSDYTRRYEVVKTLRKQPIYELRYGFDNNKHLRLLFFPYYYNDIRYLVFTKVFIKTLNPKFDPTDKLRDESYDIYKLVRSNHEEYFGEDD